jgi:hypothetical protein
MFEKKVKVIFLKSIAGEADPRHGLNRAFGFLPGDEAEIDSRLAKLWATSGICAAPDSVTVRDLLNLKLPA